MANDFSTDPRCKAVWRFENNLEDSKGGNHLTGVNGVGFDSNEKKEGSYAGVFEKANSEYAYRTDADLDSGFPFKNGDTTKKITVCFWVRPWSFVYPAYIYAKYDTNNRRSFAVARYGNYFRVYSGYNGGASYEYFDASLITSNNEWYHVGVVFDGLNKTGLMRIYRASNETVYTWSFDFNNETYVADANLTVAARHDANSSYLHDGHLDEMVVFNDLLSVIDIDRIRAGTYTGPTNCVRGETMGVLAAYSLTPEGNFVRADALGATAAYTTKLPGGRVFPVPHPKTRWQSHFGKRKFPVVN